MPERDPADRFDDLVDTILAGAAAPGDDPIAALVADLRGLPSDAFRERLGADLARGAAGRTGADMIATTYIREGFQTVTPYLRVERIEELLEFVTQAFGAVETVRAVGSAGGLHAEARIGDSMLMMGGFRGITEMPTALHLYVENADAVYQRALAAGATTLHAPVDQPYGDREASVCDPSGNYWYIATHIAGAGHRPEGLRAVTPYLHPRGAGALIAFLKDALGAEEMDRHEADGVIHHAKVRIGDSVIEMGEAHGPWQPMPTTFYLYAEDVDALYERAVRAGATPLGPPTQQPYGDRTGHVRDPHGNIWYLATHRG
jgi:PhnB protein